MDPMRDYIFCAYDGNKRLMEITLTRVSLPSHLEISLEIKKRQPGATHYTMIGTNGQELDSTPINLERYMGHEFLRFLKSVDFHFYGKLFQFVKGFHRGEKGVILSYQLSQYEGVSLIAHMESGAYATLRESDIICIEIIK